MANFDPKSRYVENATTYEAVDRRGRTLAALTVAEAPVQARLGEHLRGQGQRLDHLASFYVSDPFGFWRLAELNGAMLPDSLAERLSLDIPTVV